MTAMIIVVKYIILMDINSIKKHVHMHNQKLR
jgi:hypothetical protein